MYSKFTNSRRVLVADDDPVMRQLVTRLIEKEGYEPIVCDDGREALHLLKLDAGFGGAIFDMMMPYLHGLELIRFMRTERRLRRIPAMMITSEQDLKLMVNSYSSGATLFLTKPFSPEHFQLNLRLLLSNETRAVPLKAA
ncbi:MAG TPA: response regulator [Pyrinomonadaceae bacterium]